MSFLEKISEFDTFDFKGFFSSVTDNDVMASYQKDKLDEFDLLTLLSDRAGSHIEQMAQKANELTTQYFGRVISLYAPLYICDYCRNFCTYCGFNSKNRFKRKKLSIDEIKQEARALSDTGIKHVLILTGEDRKKASVSYLAGAIEVLKDYFSSIGIEVYSMEKNEYEILINAGADSLTVYQEVYDKRIYKTVHLSGQKTDYEYRLKTPERAASSGFRAVNIGALFGLGNVAQEAFFSGIHAKYLEKNYPEVELSVSPPRMTKAEGGISPGNLLSDSKLVQFIIAWRLFMPRLGITVSTREPAWLRDNLVNLGVTKYSAGSKTDVGGYSKNLAANVPQFELSDTRSVEEVAQMVRGKGFQVVFKDWDIL